MQAPITPTIVPPRATCGEPLQRKRADSLVCGQTVPHMRGYVAQCNRCYCASEPLARLLGGALTAIGEYGGDWPYHLAFNLAMGALLWAAACNAVHDAATPVLTIRPTREIDRDELERRLAACRDVSARAMIVDADIGCSCGSCWICSGGSL